MAICLPHVDLAGVAVGAFFSSGRLELWNLLGYLDWS